VTQTYVAEYRISVQADGSTPAPQFDIKSQPVNGIYVFEVERLGLVDLSFSGPQPASLAAAPSTIGQRYIAWAWAKGFTLGIDPSPVRAANNVEGAGYFDVELLETLPLAAVQFYSRKGYIMPHGTVLRVQNMLPGVAGIPIVLRFGVLIPQTSDEDAQIRESFCCSASVPTLTV
jgi:hypothetical protein